MLYSVYNTDDKQYIVGFEDKAKEYKWFLFDTLLDDGRIFDMTRINSVVSRKGDFLLSSLIINKVTRKEKVFGLANLVILRTVADRFLSTSIYSYPKDAVIDNTVKETADGVFKSYTAKHGDYYTSRSYVKGLLVDLSFSDGILDMQFSKGKSFGARGVEYVELEKDADARNVAANISYVTMDTLRCSCNLDFYEEIVSNEEMSQVSFDSPSVSKLTRRKKKEYKTVHNKTEYIDYLLYPVLCGIRDAKSRGEKFVFSLDTETTGFGFYKLSEGNPLLDNIVSFQVSWEKDTGVAVWLDMDSLHNCPMDFAMGKIQEILREDLFDTGEDIEMECKGEVFTFRRSDVFVVGHNTMYDSRVFRRHGYVIAFDMDTLQMAFTISSEKSFNRGLKGLTKKCFNVTYPTLTDLLGQNNEDKFKYIVDEEVASLYGCADVDYNYQLYFRLRELLSDKAFKTILKYDRPMWFLCAKSEYEGVSLDVAYVKKQGQFLARKLKAIEEFCYSYVGQVLAHMHGSDVKNPVYPFKLTGKDIGYVMYVMLKYPKLVYTKSGLPAVNVVAMKKLLTYPSDKEWLKQDIMFEGKVLIDAKKFNSYKYGLAYLLTLYKGIEKEYTAYYKPFEHDNQEGRLFKAIKTAQIATMRIGCSIQTIKSELKDFVTPSSDDYYICDFDFNQIEARIFVSEAGDQMMINKLRDPEKDYHTENAANIFGYEPHKVPPKKRKQSKGINFGIPYGLGLVKMCENLFSVVNEETKFATNSLIYDFKKANVMSMNLLEAYRESAKTPNEFIPKNLLDFWGESEVDEKGVKTYKPVGIVYNKLGTYRHFPLEQALEDKGWLASIGRKAGNFPIQSLAAYLFKMACANFYKALKAEGLEDKVNLIMYIHDEVLFEVHKSVDPRKIVTILNKSCQFRIKGHTTYFIGINFGKTWGDAKQDNLEIPALLANRIANSDYEPQKWTDDPNAIIGPLLDKFRIDRLTEVIQETDGVISDVINFDYLREHFSNYTVRSYLKYCKLAFTPDGKLSGDLIEDYKEFARFLTFLNEVGWTDKRVVAFGKIGTIEQFIKALHTPGKIEEDIELDLEEDLDLEDEEEFWSFDSTDNDYFNSYIIDETKFGNTEDTPIEVEKFAYKNEFIFKRGKTRVLSIRRDKYKDEVINYLSKFIDNEKGMRINVMSPVKSNYLPNRYKIEEHLEEIDRFLIELNGGGK